MDRFSHLVVLAVLSCLAGCVPIPVGSEHPAELADNQTLDSLIGENKTTILTSLGRPNVALIGEKSSYFIYGGHGDEYQLLLMVWVPIAGQKYPEGKLFCILLEFDEGNIFRRYRIERHSRTWSDKQNISQCASTFFSKEELKSLSTGDTEVDYLLKMRLIDMAREGDSDAQWELYEKHLTDENVTWLCRAADKGHTSARNELGELYLYGSEQYRKFKNIHIEPDLPRSCMWFHLAGKADITELPQKKDSVLALAPYETVELVRTANAMTDREMAKAEVLIRAWKPGQCERDLSLLTDEDRSKRQNMVSLCKAADYGDFSARDELGRAYFFGLNGVNQNLPRAYMWYHLAAIVYTPTSSFIDYQQSRCYAMTPEQRSAAVKYLNEWKPGLCEQNLIK